MPLKKTVEHRGIVSAIGKNEITIHIIDDISCGSCHAKGSCAFVNREDKLVKICCEPGKYSPGDKVTIINDSSMGYKALFFGYILPFLLIIFTLIAVSFITKSESIAGIISLAILVPYYFLLYIFRKKLKSAFEFRIKSD